MRRLLQGADRLRRCNPRRLRRRARDDEGDRHLRRHLRRAARAYARGLHLRRLVHRERRRRAGRGRHRGQRQGRAHALRPLDADKVFSVTVPAGLPLAVTEDGVVTSSTDAAIANNSTCDVRVTGISAAHGERLDARAVHLQHGRGKGGQQAHWLRHRRRAVRDERRERGSCPHRRLEHRRRCTFSRWTTTPTSPRPRSASTNRCLRWCSLWRKPDGSAAGRAGQGGTNDGGRQRPLFFAVSLLAAILKPPTLSTTP